MGSVLRPDGSRIRTLRIRRGWPQEQLALIAGIDSRSIRRLEGSDDASFETLRSIAGAFGLHVHELMKESGNTATHTGDLRVRLAATYGPLVSLCLPYAPAFKGLMGSFALVLLVASTICLSPLLLKHHAKMPTGELLPTFTLPSSSVLAAMNFQHQAKAQNDASSSGGRLRRVVRIIQPVPDELQPQPAPSQAGSVPSIAAATHEGVWAKTVHAGPESKVEKQAPVGGIDIGWLASLSEPESAQPALRAIQHPTQPAAVTEAGRNDPLTREGSGEISPRGPQGGLGLVIEPFRRTGKGTVILFSKVGSSLKRIF